MSILKIKESFLIDLILFYYLIYDYILTFLFLFFSNILKKLLGWEYSHFLILNLTKIKLLNQMLNHQ
jgi:hypothetical protein